MSRAPKAHFSSSLGHPAIMPCKSTFEVVLLSKRPEVFLVGVVVLVVKISATGSGQAGGSAYYHTVSFLYLLYQPIDLFAMNMLYYGDMDRVVGHTHNALLQVLALSGIVGLAIMLAFLFLQLRSAIRIYRGKQPLCQKIYPVLLASLLIYSIGEPLFDVSFTSLAFMLISGMLEESDAASA